MAATRRIQACGRGEATGVSELREEEEDSCDFPAAQQFPRFTEDGEKKKQTKSSGRQTRKKNALTSDVSMGRLVRDHREAAGSRRPAEPV